MKYPAQEVTEARDRLRELLPPGSTVYVILRHVSRSGMRRSICPLILFNGRPITLWAEVAKVLGRPVDEVRDGVISGGTGMEMGFELVYSLSHALYPDGFGCIGKGCPSDEHVNGDCDYTPHGPTDKYGNPEDREPGPGEAADGLKRHWHRCGGYALKHRWI